MDFVPLTQSVDRQERNKVIDEISKQKADRTGLALSSSHIGIFQKRARNS